MRLYEKLRLFFSQTVQLRFIKLHLGTLALGLCLCLLGILMPAFLKEGDLGIYITLRVALSNQDTTELLHTAVLLLILNSLRSAPHYLGILLLMESGNSERHHWGLFLLKYLCAFFLLLGVYQLVYEIYGIRYVVEPPALIVLLCMSALNRFPIGGYSKALLFLLFTLSIQSLDIMPGLTAWGFGRGEISMDIKQAAAILGCEPILLGFCLMTSLIFAITMLMTVLLLLDKRQMRLALEKEARIELQLMDTRLKAASMRDTFEIQSLVHDLKSPLTAIQGLASLSSAISQDQTLANYQHRICDAVDRMSYMISEILYEDCRQCIRVDELLEKVRSQYSAHEGAKLLKYENYAGQRCVCVNVVRMIRVVINLLENAARAVEGDGEIRLWSQMRGSWVVLCVWDNGRGIRRENLEHIWDIGFSKEGSTGLGLSFVRQTVQKHGGEVHIFSEAGEYTQVELLLPEANENGEENTDHRR